jgi:DNA-binding XRE family transcriptional regulator
MGRHVGLRGGNINHNVFLSPGVMTGWVGRRFCMGMPEADDDYPDEVCRRLGQRMRECRQRLGLSTYSLAIPGVLSDQTILNMEQGRVNYGIRTAALYCQRLGTTLEAMFGDAGL